MLTRGCEAQARASPDTVLSPLSRCFVRAVFLLLPVDTRLRCSEVSRAWRALLADTTLFTSLDLSISSGLASFSLPLLRAAVAKAGGQLRVLDIKGQRRAAGILDGLLATDLLQMVVANAATLADVRVDTSLWFPHQVVRALLESAPALQLFDTSVAVTKDRQAAHSMLRNEPPFQALQIRRLHMSEV